MATKSGLEKLLGMAGEFVVKQHGDWNHADWEGLVEKVSMNGVAADDESKRNLGNILEASKYFYQILPAPPPMKRAAAKKKA
ncbi:MAG: hypothetical protein HY706_14635 [Candidatus Hydrogenedentes bacterium]|nr:hypothetical protein [Candidatus Hydrogenedentota bacterium]